MAEGKSYYVIFEVPRELDDLLKLLKEWPDDGILYKVDRERSRIDFWGDDSEMVAEALLSGRRTILLPSTAPPET